MEQGTRIREEARGWLLASGIAIAAIAIFVTAMVVGGPGASGAAALEPAAPEWEPPELPRG
jgi:hypothetical protein